MSKLSEFIKLIPKAIKNPEQIIEGWLNDIKIHNDTMDEKELEIILKRRAICEDCPFSSYLANERKEYKELTGEDYKVSRKDRTDNHCTLCSCNIALATASPSKICGADYWNQEHPDKQIEVKWTFYKKD